VTNSPTLQRTRNPPASMQSESIRRMYQDAPEPVLKASSAPCVAAWVALQLIRITLMTTTKTMRQKPDTVTSNGEVEGPDDHVGQTRGPPYAEEHPITTVVCDEQHRPGVREDVAAHMDRAVGRSERRT